MATHSSILAWRIPWRKEPGRLQSTGWQGVGHDWATFSFFLSFLLYRNKRFNLPAPENVSGRQLWTLSPFWVFSAGESYYWGHKVLFFFFSSESSLHIMWPKYWSFSISPSNEYSGLISLRIDWFDLPATQEMLKSLLQHHTLKLYSSVLSILYGPTLTSVHDN